MGSGGSRIGAVTEGRGGRRVISRIRRAYQQKRGIRQEVGRRPVDGEQSLIDSQCKLQQGSSRRIKGGRCVNSMHKEVGARDEICRSCLRALFPLP